jgi:hypothetical protein
MNVLQTLKSERDRLQKEVNKLSTAIKVLGGSASTGPSTASNRPILSAAGRARIAAAQSARRQHAQEENNVGCRSWEDRGSPACEMGDRAKAR